MKVGYYTITVYGDYEMVWLRGDLEGMRRQLTKMGFKPAADGEMYIERYISFDDIVAIGRPVKKFCQSFRKVAPDYGNSVLPATPPPIRREREKLLA